jgi:hypothetical protein
MNQVFEKVELRCASRRDNPRFSALIDGASNGCGGLLAGGSRECCFIGKNLEIHRPPLENCTSEIVNISK